MKTEPDEWSWKDQVEKSKKGAVWDGVRNFQARNNLKEMNINDLCFFYQTGKEKKIVGIVKVIKKYFADTSDTTGNFGSIMVQSYKKFKQSSLILT